MYHVTRAADLYMRGERRNVPPSRALGALPPVPIVHSVQCTRTDADAVRGQPVVRPTIVEWARTGRGALVGVWCVGEPVCPSVRREPV